MSVSRLGAFTGDSQPMDVCSVHHDNTFLRYSVSLLGYGFYGDVLSDSEKRRWLGPARYNLSGMRVLVWESASPLCGLSPRALSLPFSFVQPKTCNVR